MDPGEQAKDSSNNYNHQDKYTSVNPEDKAEYSSEHPKRQDVDTNLNPEEKVADASSNKTNHDKSKVTRIFDIDIHLVDEDDNNPWRTIYEAIYDNEFEKNKRLLMSYLNCILKTKMYCGTFQMI